MKNKHLINKKKKKKADHSSFGSISGPLTSGPKTRPSIIRKIKN